MDNLHTAQYNDLPYIDQVDQLANAIRNDMSAFNLSYDDINDIAIYRNKELFGAANS
jgi:formylmethanofuran dehydrogenase subunit E-like metal-binding protein